jgi:hypothetical protein
MINHGIDADCMSDCVSEEIGTQRYKIRFCVNFDFIPSSIFFVKDIRKAEDADV